MCIYNYKQIDKKRIKNKKLIIYKLFLYLNQSFGESVSNIKIDDLEDLPSTYEEEEFIDEENTNQQILQQVRYEEPKKSDRGIITVEIKALDKITAKTSTLNIKIGEEKELVEKVGEEFVVKHQQVIRIAERVNLDHWDVMAQFMKVLHNKGVSKKLFEMKIKPGDIVKIGRIELEWS